MAKSKIGEWMISVAVVLALLAVLLWSRHTEDGTAPLTAAGTAAVLFLGGVILVASKDD